MTESKAINDIRNRECIECIGNEIGCGSCAYKMAIQALEKQIPKKPVDRCMFEECPTCGCVEIQNCGYCTECGQKLDWSDE